MLFEEEFCSRSILCGNFNCGFGADPEHTRKFNNADGDNPTFLVQGTDGNFYGVAYYGGNSSNCPLGLGCGTLFRVTPSGTLSGLHTFCSQANCTDGSAPIGALVQGASGNFYGVTQRWGK